jgi:hypothetical protein
MSVRVNPCGHKNWFTDAECPVSYLRVKRMMWYISIFHYMFSINGFWTWSFIIVHIYKISWRSDLMNIWVGGNSDDVEWGFIFRLTTKDIFVLWEMTACTSVDGAPDFAVGWGNTLQAWRSRVRFPMVSLEFFIDIIPPAALWSWGWFNL